MVFLTGSGTRHCPVEGCIGLVETQTDMLVHLWYQYVQDTVVIIEKGNLSHPQCPPCDMAVLWRSLNVSHKIRVQCKKGAERKRRSLTVEEAKAANSSSFSAYRRTLEMVPYLKYLVIVLSAADDDWLEVIRNLTKAWAVWKRISRILSR